MNRLVVLGSVNADHVLRVPHFPRPGETLTGHSYQVVPGGKGANQAVAAARLGAPVSFIARIGDDAIGQQMRQGFEQDGIDVSAVELDETLPTGIAIIYVSDEGENSIGISAEANGALSPAMVKRHEAMIADAHTLLLQLEVPLESVFEAAKLARSHGTRVVLNPAPAQPLSSELLALVDLITPNQTEAELLTGVKVSDEGENSIGLSTEANGALDIAMVKRHEAMIAGAHTLLLQLEVPLESVFEAAKLARSHGTRVVLNPAPAQPLSADLLALVDLITPNQTEAELLTGVKVTGEANAAQASARFHQMGIADVMITLGSQGVYCSNGQQQALIPGFRVEAVDTTAAGDTFNGALLAAELAGADFHSAVRFAHGAAALSVTRFGAQSSIPGKQEVDTFLQSQAAQGL